MPYITFPSKKREYQITFEDILNGVNASLFERNMEDTRDTRTVFRETTPIKLLEKFSIPPMIDAIRSFNEKHRDYITADKQTLYETFYLSKRNKGFDVVMRGVYRTKISGHAIPSPQRLYKQLTALFSPLLSNHPCSEHADIKARVFPSVVEYLNNSGFNISCDVVESLIKDGYRRIDAPTAEFKSALTELKELLENRLFGSYHTAAFAYVKGRSTVDAIKRHQRNKSRWFLKLDFSNFFGATTQEFVINQLRMIFPYSEILETNTGRDALTTALSIGFLNGSLPQGTPLSPTLTNIMMIPIDHAIAKMARENTPHLCYTRYADDIILSSDLSFEWSSEAEHSVQNKVINILNTFSAPFNINTSKTRYGSSAGRNWNLGLMLNKDNQITIGHEKKKAFKATLYSFLKDYANGIVWAVEDVQILGGQISYYRMIEKANIDSIIQTYNKKFNMDSLKLIKNIISGKM